MKKILCLFLGILILISSLRFNYVIKVNANNITWNETQVNGKDTVTALKDTNAGFDYRQGYKLNVIRADGNYAFCIEPNVLLKEASYSTTYLDPSDTPMRRMAIAKWIHFDRRKYGGTDYSTDVRDGFDYSIAQLLIWKIGGQSVDMSAWFKEDTIRSYIDPGVYQIDEWDKWPSYVGKEFKVNRGEVLNLDSPCEGKYLYTDASDVEITYSDAPGYSTKTDDRYTRVVNSYKQQYQIKVGNNVPKEFDIYVSQESPQMQKNMLSSQSPIIYKSSVSQNLISGGYIKPDVKKFRVKINDKSIKIKKVAEDGTAIQNVKFEVASDREFNNIIGRATTNNDGNAFITEGLSKYETVYIREVYVDKPYIKSDDVKEVRLNSSETTVVNFVNKKIKGKIKVVKYHKKWSFDNDVEELNEKEAEKAVKFEILDENRNKIQELITNENGEAISEDLTYGNYFIIQKSQFDGTAIANEIQVSINENEKVYTLEIENNNLKSKLKIHKVDENGKIVRVSGIKFNLYKGETKLSIDGKSEFTTDENGEVYIDKYLPFGEYKIKEVYVPDYSGFVLSDEEVRFNIDGTKDIVEVQFKNNKQLGEIIVNKTGGEVKSFDTIDKYGYQVLKPVISEVVLQGVNFKLVDDNGNSYESTTDEAGQAKFTNLKLGHYQLIETKALPGYIANKDVLNIDLTAEKSSIKIVQKSLSIKNEKKQLKVNLKKNIEDSKLHPEYKNIAFDSIIFGLYSKNDGKLYKSNQLIDVSKLDNEFNAKFELYDDGEYYLKELNTGEMYVLDDNAKEFSINYDNVDETFTIMLESVNNLKRGNIKIYKSTAHNGERLSNIKFILCDEEGNKISEHITDENGEITISNLEYGNYILKEENLDGYIKLDDIPVKIEEDGKELSYDIKNEVIPTIHTTATVDGEKEINNAELIVLKDRLYYKNIVPNTEYKVVASLVDRSTGKIIAIDEKEISQELTFVSNETEGYKDIEFEIDARKIGDRDVVVIEELYKNNKLIVEHKELDNEEQTVYFRNPSIETYATINDLKEFNGIGRAKIIDEVSYKNLYLNKEYKVTGKLIDKDTGKPILVDGKEVTAETKFTPNESYGKVHLEFDVDVSKIEAKNIVLFDNLYLDDQLLFVHEDINNNNQTVKITKPNLPPTGVGDKVGKHLFFIIMGVSGYLLISRLNRKYR